MTGPSPPRPIAVVSYRPWNAGLAAEVRTRTGWPTTMFTSRADFTPNRLAALSPRWVFVAHWSWLIPPEIHEEHEVVIFHMTDVPYGRGGSPLQNLIARGHEATVLSALRCTSEVDAGPVYLKRPLSLHGSAEEVLLRASDLMADMIVEIVEGDCAPLPQSGEAVHFPRRSASDSNLAQASSLNEAYDLIRMLDAEGYPHAFVDVGPLRLTFRRASRRSDGIHADVRISEVQDLHPDA